MTLGFPANAGKHPQIDTKRSLDPDDTVTVDLHVACPVVAENTAVSVRPGNVVDIIVADNKVVVLRPDIDGTGVNQHPGNSLSKAFAHTDFVTFNDTGEPPFLLDAIVMTKSDGAVGEILEVVVTNQEIPPLAIDNRAVGQLISVVDEPVILNSRSQAGILNPDAGPVAFCKKVIVNKRIFRPLYPDGARTDALETAARDPHGPSLQVAHADQPGVAAVSVSQKVKALHPKRLKPYTLEIQESNRAASVQ